MWEIQCVWENGCTYKCLSAHMYVAWQMHLWETICVMHELYEDTIIDIIADTIVIGCDIARWLSGSQPTTLLSSRVLRHSCRNTGIYHHSLSNKYEHTRKKNWHYMHVVNNACKRWIMHVKDLLIAWSRSRNRIAIDSYNACREAVWCARYTTCMEKNTCNLLHILL